MKTQSRMLLGAVALVCVFVFVACGPSTSTPTPLPTPENLSVDVTPAAYPQIVKQVPLPGERLGLSPEIQIGFDRPMDQDRTESAWAFLDSQGNPVEGKIGWVDEQTLRFKPEKALEPGESYSLTISTSASSTDGARAPARSATATNR